MDKQQRARREHYSKIADGYPAQSPPPIRPTNPSPPAAPPPAQRQGPPPPPVRTVGAPQQQRQPQPQPQPRGPAPTSPQRGAPAPTPPPLTRAAAPAPQQPPTAATTFPTGVRLTFKADGRGRAPGEVFWRAHTPGDCIHWDHGCDGKHLIVILPNGREWDIHSRAPNCDKTELEHRCWVVRGDPTTGIITVDKHGDMCAAGGAVSLAGYQGVIQDGKFNP